MKKFVAVMGERNIYIKREIGNPLSGLRIFEGPREMTGDYDFQFLFFLNKFSFIYIYIYIYIYIFFFFFFFVFDICKKRGKYRSITLIPIRPFHLHHFYFLFNFPNQK